MFASGKNITDPTTGDVTGYISNASIRSIANQTVQGLGAITPYSVFPTILFEKARGMAWWRKMTITKKMQGQRISAWSNYHLFADPSKISTVVPSQPAVMEPEYLRFSLRIVRSPLPTPFLAAFPTWPVRK